MREEIKKPKGFVEEQVSKLSDDIRHDLIHGTQEEAAEAVIKLRTYEREKNISVLGQTAWELIWEQRTFTQKQKELK